MRGVNLSNNVWGNWIAGISEKLQAEGNDPLIRPKTQDDWVLTDMDFDLINGFGGNVVRYAVNHELFSRDNPSREANLKKLIQHIEKFNRLNIYVILCLHLPKGLDVQNDNFERLKLGAKRIASIFENAAYWDDTLEMWEYIAAGLKNYPGLAGYELFNEPRLPSNKDGGIKAFQDKYAQLCRLIRKIDPRHIIFVPAYNSRESNPGGQYWDESQKKMVTDQGEQGIVWGQEFVNIPPDIKNAVYVFHVYEPFAFTHQGAADFGRDALFAYVNERSAWAKQNNVPLLATEYGCNSLQEKDKAVEYLSYLHQLFKQNNISAVYFEYKSKIGAYILPANIFGVYGQDLDADKKPISIMDNETIKQELKRFCGG